MNMNIPEYWQNLTPRRRLNDAVHRYAKAHGGDYRQAWRHLEKIYSLTYRIDVRAERRLYAEKYGTLPTIPVWFEMQGIMDRVITLALSMP